MRVLVLNCGSATVKFQLLASEGPVDGARWTGLARGVVEKTARGARFEAGGAGLDPPSGPPPGTEPGAAVEAILSWLSRAGGEGRRPEAVGHRVVHGGETFGGPALLDEESLRALEALSSLAPLHNPPGLEGIRAARRALGDGVPQVAVFDTSFHRTLPLEARTYAIPQALAARHHIRRYGFHGIAHQYLCERYAALRSLPPNEVDLITLHLGGGSSACAIKAGRSIDTSMGMTPLEGLVMGTRSGDIDPALVSLLARAEGVSADQVDRWLNHESGLLGISGRSSDMREVLAGAAAGLEPSRLALSVFVHRARKYLGAYLAVLGGADAVVFSGGIGEHAPAVRAAICRGMEWCGLELDGRRNDRLVAGEGPIGAEGNPLEVWVIPADEERLIARETLSLLGGSGAGGGPRRKESHE